MSDGQFLRNLIDRDDEILNMIFSPDGLLLAFGTDYGVVQFWGTSEVIPLEAEPVIATP